MPTPRATPMTSESATTIPETWSVTRRPLPRNGSAWRMTSMPAIPDLADTDRVAALEQPERQEDGGARDQVHGRHHGVDLDDPEGVEVDPLRAVGELGHGDHAGDRGVLEERDHRVAHGR